MPGPLTSATRRSDSNEEQLESLGATCHAASAATGRLVRSAIWMPYGDIVLQAECTQFRVNKDILATHSDVFRDLFEIPQPEWHPDSDDEEPEILEGCPVVLLTDAGRDWEIFLAVLYGDPFFPKIALDFDLLAALLRLGKKYEITRAKEDALWRIRHEFPRDFRAFNELDADLTKIKYRKGIYADLLHLAYECELYSSLPLLAFCCLRSDSLETILSGIPRDDDSRVTLPNELRYILAIAHERMALFQHKNLAWLRDGSVVPHSQCASSARCEQQRIAMAKIVDDDHCSQGRFNLGYMIDQWDPRWTGMMCSLCEDSATTVYERGREKGWELLPSFLGLTNWQELDDVV